MTGLSEELESRIKADYLQEFGYELYFGNELQDKFYGIYNGAAVFFISGDNAVVKTVTISGLEFSYGYDWTIWVWKVGNCHIAALLFEQQYRSSNTFF